MIRILIASFFIVFQTHAQLLNTPLRGLNDYEVDRMQVLNNDMGRIHTSTKPILRSDVLTLLDSSIEMSTKSRNAMFILRDNSDLNDTLKSKKPFLKFFYTNPRNLFEWRTSSFYVNINPVLYFRAGFDNNRFIFRNTRGATIQGNILKKLFFYVDVLETQQLLPGYIDHLVVRDNSVPSAGSTKGI